MGDGDPGFALPGRAFVLRTPRQLGFPTRASSTAPSLVFTLTSQKLKATGTSIMTDQVSGSVSGSITLQAFNSVRSPSASCAVSLSGFSKTRRDVVAPEEVVVAPATDA